ncbi:DinB family protein [Mesobacillus jeotgali]|uniref:DinB family protein n=1 Tax=Mesobacillus jeotgali TaxID=129985 RepID=UPI002147FEFD|nr:DinB family protein [Mesobacillus jeotgali]
MVLEHMKEHYVKFDGWIESLRNLKDSEWHKPLAEGSWTVAAVVSHLLFWDKYSLEERFPLFKEGAILPSYPDFQYVNDRAREYAEKQASKDQILDELLAVRKEFHSILEKMDSKRLGVSFKISDHQMTINTYFTDFILHDLHHQRQVDAVLGRTVTK